MKSIKEIIQSAYVEFKDRNFVFSKKDGSYLPITYGELISKADGLAHKLVDENLTGERIIIIGKNSVEYMIADLAVTAFVGVCANINQAIDIESLGKIIEKAKIAAVFYDEEQSEKIQSLKSQFNDVKFWNLQKTVAELNTSEPSFDLPGKDPEACSKIIFTSGTTSTPKGVMLSLNNMLAGWKSLQKRTNFDKSTTETIYVFLPMSHTYCNIYNFYYSFFYAPELYLCSDTSLIGQEILEVNPTVFCAVPIIYRRLYDAYGKNVAKAFGTRIKYLYVGGAIFDKKLRRFYNDNGVKILEAYALTETASSFAVDYPDNDDFESTGAIFENLDVQVRNPDEKGVGNIVVKGESIFLGYLNEPEKTRKAFTKDGYFITGDYGYVKDGKLYILGRNNDIIVGENGENVYLSEVLANLNKISELVSKITATIREDGLLEFTIFASEQHHSEIPKLIEKYNEHAIKKDRIDNYEIQSDKNISFK